MNRFHIVTVLLLMFLNCSNSTNPPYREKAKTAIPATTSALSKEQKLLASRLNDLFVQFNRSGIFNGSVLVARSGKIIYQNALGFSDKKNKSALTDSSMFQLASVSKVITSTAVLMLHEREMLDINKTFKSYFPDFPSQCLHHAVVLNQREFRYTARTARCRPSTKNFLSRLNE